MMYKNSKALDGEVHADLRFKPASDFAFASDLVAAPLAPFEVSDAQFSFPILFSTEGPVTALAILGMSGRNVFLDSQNRWTASYVPAHIRRYPFILGKLPDRDGFLLAADLDAPHFAAADGEPVFKDKVINPAFDGVIKMLEEYEGNLEAGRKVLAELETSGILVEGNVTISDGTTKHVVGGFRMIDVAKMTALDDATLARWVRNGVMEVVQAHLNSVRHLDRVAQASSRPNQLQ